MPRLILAPGASQYSFGGLFTIGRSKECSYALEGEYVSRVHCNIFINNGKWYITDRSSNGTLVNSRKCFHKTIPLNHNDVVKIGEHEFCYKEQLEDETVCSSDHDSTVIVIDEETEQDRVPAPAAPTTSDLDAELKCSICWELFVKTTMLNCSHIFCTQCIQDWKRYKPICPKCRKPVDTCTNSNAIDNLINKIVSEQSAADQLARMELIKAREAREQAAYMLLH